MAKFEGAGTFILSGGSAKLYDIEIFNDGGVQCITDNQWIYGCRFAGDGGISVTNNDEQIIISNNWFSTSQGTAISLEGNNFQTSITDNVFDGCSQDGIVVTNANGVTITGNTFASMGTQTDDTYDCIRLAGTSSRNFISANQFHPNTAGNLSRSAVNVAGGECNMVVGNDLGDPDDYGTDALIDTGANTQIFWPNDATYGDNFFDCGTGS